MREKWGQKPGSYQPDRHRGIRKIRYTERNKGKKLQGKTLIKRKGLKHELI